MNRARKTRVSSTRNPHEGNRTIGRSITDLPRFISETLLLLLSVNTLLICRCVCKTWRSIISSPQFAKSHFAKAEVYPLVRSLSFSRVNISRTLYLVEPRDYNFSSNETGHQIKMKLGTKLKIPLRNFDIALRDVDPSNPSNDGSKRKGCAKVRAIDQRFYVANTCNGLLCLSEPSKNEQLAVCNPITGEFIKLGEDKDKGTIIDCALGFSPQTNQYKVIRMFEEYDYKRSKYESPVDPITGEVSRGCLFREAEIYTLGTRSWSSWRRLGSAPKSSRKLGFPTYLNGAVHWLYLDQAGFDKIISFDFVTEKFLPILPPPDENDMYSLRDTHISLGTLRGCLCLCVAVESAEILIYVMKDYGVQGSWTVERRLTTRTPAGRWLEGKFEVVSVLGNGCLLISHPVNGMFYYNSDGSGFKFLKIRGANCKYEVIASYVPSFISLKDAIAGENVEVLNINSRCAGLKLDGETKSLFLEEKDANMETEFSSPAMDPDDEFGDPDCW